MGLRYCEVCKKQFVNNSGTHRYCSNDCREIKKLEFAKIYNIKKQKLRIENIERCENKNHLCNDCYNQRADRCLKVKLLGKKPVTDFDFVIDSHEDEFFCYVYACKNFKVVHNETIGVFKKL